MEKENGNCKKDQLCHIFNYGAATLCLICKKIISGAVSPRGREERISNHLESSDHGECIRNLFKMCISDPVCDTNNEKYLDIATKSIFDISLLLGEEKSYICQKEDQLVCLMCKSSVSEITSSFAQIKARITQHLESSMHSNSIKEVCWYYRLNSKKEYLLLYKSIWHCSVCEDTIECGEVELLQNAIEHLESNIHKVRLQYKRLNLKKDEGSSKAPTFGDDCKGFNKSAHVNTTDFMGLKDVSEKVSFHLKIEPDEQPEPQANFDKKGTMDDSEGISGEKKIGLKFFLDDLCAHGRQDKMIFDKCLFCVKKALKRLNPCKRDEKCFIIKYGIGLCKICKEPFSMTDLNSLAASYATHFESESHKQNMIVKFQRKGIQKLKEIDNTNAVDVFESISREIEIVEKFFLHNLCVHRRKQPKIFDKCLYCLRRALRRLNPGKRKRYLLISPKEGIVCKICKEMWFISDLNSLITSYVTHLESESHKQCAREFFEKEKPELKEGRKTKDSMEANKVNDYLMDKKKKAFERKKTTVKHN